MQTLTGKNLARVVSTLRTGIDSGRYSVGNFMPTTRELSEKLGVAPETVRRAMKTLEADRMVISWPRQGFKIVRRSNQPEPTMPVACILAGEDRDSTWASFAGSFLVTMQRLAARAGLNMMGLSADGVAPGQIAEQLRANNMTGVVLDGRDAKVTAAVVELGLPIVAAEASDPENRFDSVVQDSFGGACRAAEHLASRGHKRIAWLGPVARSYQGMERWGGAVAGLRRHGMEFPAEFVVDRTTEEGLGPIDDLLARPDRPTAVIAPWRHAAVAAARAAAKAGLAVGRDVDIVGWATEEQYAEYADMFPDGNVPTTVVWSMKSLAETVITRLVERRRSPDAPTMHIKIATALRAASEGR